MFITLLRLVGEMGKGRDGFDVEDEYARFRRRQRIQQSYFNEKLRLVTIAARPEVAPYHY